MLQKSKRPEWAHAKVRFYFATCWVSSLDDECPDMAGINWFHDKLLIACTWFHNFFVQPFCPDNVGFPMRILEVYDSE